MPNQFFLQIYFKLRSIGPNFAQFDLFYRYFVDLATLCEFKLNLKFNIKHQINIFDLLFMYQ